MTTTATTMAMNTLTETLARATLRGPGGAFPRKANAPDFPLVSTFYLSEGSTNLYFTNSRFNSSFDTRLSNATVDGGTI